MANNKRVELRKIENFVRKKFYPEIRSKSLLQWQPLLWLIIGLGLNNYRAKFQVERISCSGDIEWCLVEPLLPVCEVSKKRRVGRVKVEFPT